MKLSTEKLRFLTVETHVTKHGSFLKTPFINLFCFFDHSGWKSFWPSQTKLPCKTRVLETPHPPLWLDRFQQRPARAATTQTPWAFWDFLQSGGAIQFRFISVLCLVTEGTVLTACSLEVNCSSPPSRRRRLGQNTDLQTLPLRRLFRLRQSGWVRSSRWLIVLDSR